MGVVTDASRPRWISKATTTKANECMPVGENAGVKVPIALFIAGLAVAAVAFVADAWLVLLASVALIGAAALVLFVLGWRAASQADAQASYVAVLAGSLVAAGLGIASIVVGVRGDAPGLVLLGIAIVVADLVGVFAVGLRNTLRGG